MEKEGLCMAPWLQCPALSTSCPTGSHSWTAAQAGTGSPWSLSDSMHVGPASLRSLLAPGGQGSCLEICSPQGCKRGFKKYTFSKKEKCKQVGEHLLLTLQWGILCSMIPVTPFHGGNYESISWRLWAHVEARLGQLEQK